MQTAAALLAMAQATAPASAALPSALASAGDFCELASRTQRMTLPPGAEFYMDIPGETGGVKPLDQVPPLVTRFAATQPAGRFGGVSGFAHWRTSNGDVWTVQYGAGGCDLMVTNGERVAEAAGTFADVLPSRGYTLVKTVEGSAQSPLFQRLLVKRTPASGRPALATRVLMEWLAPSAQEATGVQLSISYRSGDTAPATSPVKP